MIKFISISNKSNGQTLTVPEDATMVVCFGNKYGVSMTYMRIGGIDLTMSIVGGDGLKVTGYLAKPNLPTGNQVVSTDETTTTYSFAFFKGTLSARALLSLKLGNSAGSLDTEVTTNPADTLVCWSIGGTQCYDVEDSTSFTAMAGGNWVCGYKRPSAQSDGNTETIRYYSDGATCQGGWISLVDAPSGGDSAMQNTAEGICI